MFSTLSRSQLDTLHCIRNVHPLIAVHPEITRRLVSCLLEYSKFEHSRRDQPLRMQPASISWCITRLRRLTHSSSFHSKEPERTSREDNEDQIQKRVDQLICELDDSVLSGSLRHEKTAQLLDISLLLLGRDQTRPLIEKLVTSAIELLERDYIYGYWGATDPPAKADDSEDDDESDELIQQIKAEKHPISQKFLNSILHHEDSNENHRLWNIYQEWPWHFKSRIWRFYDQFLEAEVADVVSSIGIRPDYVSSQNMNLILNDMSLVQTLLMDGQHFRKVYTILAKSVISSGDWRVFRVLWHLFGIVIGEHPIKVKQKYLPAELMSAIPVISSNSPIPELCEELHAALKSYIYAGTLDGMSMRRCHAWLFPLMYPKFIYRCTLTTMTWCSEKDQRWNEDVDAAWRTMAWLACPSDDDRLDNVLEHLRLWFLSLKGFCDNDVEAIIQLFSSEWHSVFNGNIVLALITTLSAMSLLQHYSSNDYLMLLDAILRFGTLPTMNGQGTAYPYNASIVYLLNDYLPMWESLLNPSMTFNNDDSLFSDYSLSTKIRHITTHVNSIITSL
ncbi:hypothetical protein BJV82DRAFT_633331 [Fennellomyces sp. T-0311]|nr:hypothetical protein BJV82DRAFT_633331 [Fennellomyces sp. T-0311]